MTNVVLLWRKLLLGNSFNLPSLHHLLTRTYIYVVFLYEHACSYNAYDNASAVGGHVAKSQKDSTKGRSQDIFLFSFLYFLDKDHFTPKIPFVSRKIRTMAPFKVICFCLFLSSLAIESISHSSNVAYCLEGSCGC